MKRILFFGTLIILLLIYGLYLSQYQITVARPQIGIQNPDNFYDYKGLTHVHSHASTGSGTYDEIIKSAQRLKFDYLFFTELNPDFHKTGAEGYHQNLLVLSGGEYSYLDSRLMYYNVAFSDPPVGKGKSQVFFADLLSQKNRAPDSGFVILAHPFLSKYLWSGPYPEGLNGIEIINLKRVLEAAWLNSKVSSITSLFFYPFNPNLALIRLYNDSQEELFLWDQLNKSNKTFGFMGTDATARAVIFPGFDLKFPSYETSFAIGSNHLLITDELTGDSDRDSEKVLTALQKGQFYICLDIIANPKGFSIFTSSKNKAYLMGSKIKLAPDTQLKIQLPSHLEVPYEVRIYKDGELYLTSNSLKTEMNITAPGTYRAVVRVIPTFPFPEGKRWISWIYSNPFYIE